MASGDVPTEAELEAISQRAVELTLEHASKYAIEMPDGSRAMDSSAQSALVNRITQQLLAEWKAKR